MRVWMMITMMYRMKLINNVMRLLMKPMKSIKNVLIVNLKKPKPNVIIVEDITVENVKSRCTGKVF